MERKFYVHVYSFLDFVKYYIRYRYMKEKQILRYTCGLKKISRLNVRKFF